jgi:guanylate kinase
MSNESGSTTGVENNLDVKRDIASSVCGGRLIVVSGPSGAGKSSLVRLALSRLDRLHFSVSHTTRAARGAERNAVEYFFVSKEEFLAMRERGEFLEYAEVYGHFYGTSRCEIEKANSQGLDVLLDIDVQGADQVRSKFPEAITTIVLPPSREVLEERLRTRNLNRPEDLERRLRTAAAEVKRFREFDYVIVNDDLERAASQLEAIILAERQRVERQAETAETIISSFGGDLIYG